MRSLDMAALLTHDELEGRAASLIDAAMEAGLLLRAVGGVGVRMGLRNTRERYDTVRAVPRDIDLVSKPRPGRKMKEVFVRLGYRPDERIIAWRGDLRHVYYALDSTGDVLFHIDVFIGTPPTCHRIDLNDRLPTDARALDPSDLLLLKLQIVEINEKDLLDAAFLLLEEAVTHGQDAEPSREQRNPPLDVSRIARLLADDWGFHHTATANLQRIREAAPRLLAASEARLVVDRVADLGDAIAAEPRTLRWRLRARIGTRMQWFEPVEDIER
jgi:hypothetical protein